MNFWCVDLVANNNFETKSKASQMKMNKKVIIIARRLENKQWVILNSEYSAVNNGWQITSLPAGELKCFGRKLWVFLNEFSPPPDSDVTRINFSFAYRSPRQNEEKWFFLDLHSVFRSNWKHWLEVLSTGSYSRGKQYIRTAGPLASKNVG